MLNNKYHETRYLGRTPVLIDLAQLPSGEYEVMVLKPDGEDFDSFRTKDFDRAELMFNAFCEKYPRSMELPAKYQKLSDDLKAALEAGRAAESKYSFDGGTCNFDSPCVKLPRWNANLVEEAARQAGTSAFKWNLYGSIRWVFCPDTGAQGTPRTANAEAMCDYLLERGWDAGMYYQCD